MKIYSVNLTGLEKIKQFVLENHKHPEEATTDIALSRWASEAEDMVDINAALLVEIPADDCIHGHGVSLNLDESCADVVILED